MITSVKTFEKQGQSYLPIDLQLNPADPMGVAIALLANDKRIAVVTDGMELSVLTMADMAAIKENRALPPVFLFRTSLDGTKALYLLIPKWKPGGEEFIQKNGWGFTETRAPRKGWEAYRSFKADAPTLAAFSVGEMEDVNVELPNGQVVSLADCEVVRETEGAVVQAAATPELDVTKMVQAMEAFAAMAKIFAK
jgi:hypothetical protein